ncbi:MAG: hypothetical protein CL910_10655 [Deltaproteobacteria bacterium]|nr:hypothetical protein [Deltaproteobacteria bacterium]
MADATERVAGDPRGRIPFYRALLASVLSVLLACGGLAYLWTMRNLYPGVAVARVPTAEEAPGAPLRTGPRRRVRVIQPASNIACAAERRFDLWAQVLHWQRLGESMGFRMEVGGLERVPQGPGAVDALIVPWVLCLDPAERRALDRFAAAGGGIILAGGAGLSEAPPEPFQFESHFVVPAGRTAPTSALDPGRRLELPLDSPARTSEDGTPMLWWSRWKLRPTSAKGGPWQPAATLSAKGARRAWFGFPASHAAPGSEAELDRVRSLALQWVAGDTVVAVAPWPEGKRFAWVVALDVQGPEAQIGSALAALSEQGLRATVFAYADAAGRGARLRKALAGVAELGSRGDRRTRFLGGTRIHQRQKLREGRERLGALHPRPVRGLRVPQESFDALTLHESVLSGYGYVLGAPDFDRAFPRWVSAEGRRIALVSRAGTGDRRDGPGAAPATDVHRDLARMAELSGLFVMTPSREHLATASGRSQLARLVAEARAGGAWQATAGEAVAWARARSRLALTSVSAGGLEVANRGTSPARDVVLELYGPSLAPSQQILPTLAPDSAVRVSLPAKGVAIAPKQAITEAAAR